MKNKTLKNKTLEDFNTPTEYKIYMELKGINKDDLTMAESNILQILCCYDFNRFNEVL